MELLSFPLPPPASHGKGTHPNPDSWFSRTLSYLVSVAMANWSAFAAAEALFAAAAAEMSHRAHAHSASARGGKFVSIFSSICVNYSHWAAIAASTTPWRTAIGLFGQRPKIGILVRGGGGLTQNYALCGIHCNFACDNELPTGGFYEHNTWPRQDIQLTRETLCGLLRHHQAPEFTH